MNTYEQDQQAAKIQRHLAMQEQVFQDWLAVHPEYNNMANIRLLKNYYHSEDWSYNDLSESAALLAAKGIIQKLSPKTDEQTAAEEWDERLELVDYILENGKYQPESKAAERARFLRRVNGENGSGGFPVVSIDTLRQLKANIDTRRVLGPLSKNELKAKVHQEWADQATEKFGRPGMWKPLPELMRSREMLLSATADELRGYIQTCGVEQINFYLKKIED